ncbi:SAGA-associated factor 73-like [Vicia villosa]|uniref:SAGA-associated factor 73-like n=1 Tax=Vicia villosa TaxID=3911 RepID=UPI00273C43D3|nr:SAGA-associated factor 73-like [Vicia villosa]XP_058753759.1 SAGA-associated factor 73-like [Vicia villosa]
MIKRRFFKVDHGDRDGSDHSSSSSDEDYDNQTTEVSQESDDDDNEVSSPSGYKSEDSSANDIDANTVDTNSAGPLFSEDDAGTINDREVFINKFSSERDSKKFNVVPEKKPLPADIQSAFVVQIKSVFKCRLCPRIICLTEDTLRNHLQSKRHARSEKQHKEGRLKTMLNSDGEIENQEDSEKETEDTEDDTIPKNDKVPNQHKERFKKKNRDKPNSRKMRSSKGSSKRSRKK